MTRDEAYRRIQVIPRSSPSMHDVVFIIELLGLIKFDEPKPSVHDEVCRELQTVAVKIVRDNVAVVGTLTLNSTINLIEAIERAGLKIVKVDEPMPKSGMLADAYRLADALRSAWCAAGQKDATQGSIAIKEALENCGFQIVRKP